MDTNNSQHRDEKLWKAAKRRVEFKKHFFFYILVNIFLWGLWAFVGLKRGDYNFPWPAFVTFGWGIGVVFNYIGAYSGLKDSYTEREYQKMINKGN